ncbi:MAG: ABC transporter permease [Solirubrobacteraceae bacterium]
MTATTLDTDVFDVGALGPPIKGPQALSGDWRRFWHLTFNIAKTQWKMRFFGSVLGYFWQLIRPLLLFGVLYVFFTKVAHVGQGVGTGPGQPDHFYGAQLLGSIVLFTFLAEGTSGAVRCVVDNEVLVRKIQFPRMVIPLSVVLLALFNVSLNMIVVFVFALIEGVRPMLSWVELPLIVAMIGVLAAGLAMLLSTAFVYFRDVQPIWEVAMQILFYASPVIIPMVTVANHLSPLMLHLYMLNPLAVAIQQFKHAVINHGAYGAAAYAGGYAWVAIPVVLVLVIFALGFWVFNRAAPQVAENL